jgi:hypothetical protein
VRFAKLPPKRKLELLLQGARGKGRKDLEETLKEVSQRHNIPIEMLLENQDV